MSHTSFTPVAIQLRQVMWNDAILPNDTMFKQNVCSARPTNLYVFLHWMMCQAQASGEMKLLCCFSISHLCLIGWRRSVRQVLMKTYQWSGTVKVIPGPEARQRCYLHEQPSLIWLKIWCNVIPRKAAPFIIFLLLTLRQWHYLKSLHICYLVHYIYRLFLYLTVQNLSLPTKYVILLLTARIASDLTISDHDSLWRHPQSFFNCGN